MTNRKYPHVLTLRVHEELVQRIRRAAASDDRRPGAYLRRLLDATVPREG